MKYYIDRQFKVIRTGKWRSYCIPLPNLYDDFKEAETVCNKLNSETAIHYALEYERYAIMPYLTVNERRNFDEKVQKQRKHDISLS